MEGRAGPGAAAESSSLPFSIIKVDDRGVLKNWNFKGREGRRGQEMTLETITLTPAPSSLPLRTGMEGRVGGEQIPPPGGPRREGRDGWQGGAVLLPAASAPHLQPIVVTGKWAPRTTKTSPFPRNQSSGFFFFFWSCDFETIEIQC